MTIAKHRRWDVAPMSRVLVLGLGGAILLLVGGAAVIFFVNQGHGSSSCDVLVDREAPVPNATAVTDELLDRHPAIRAALDAEIATGASAAHEFASCADHSAAVADLDRAGVWASVPRTIYHIVYDGGSYRVEMYQTVS